MATLQHLTDPRYVKNGQANYTQALANAKDLRFEQVNQYIGNILQGRSKHGKNNAYVLQHVGSNAPQKMEYNNSLGVSAYKRKINYKNGSGQYAVLYGN